MTECHLLSSFNHWDKTTLAIKSKLSALTLNSMEVLEEAKTGTIMITIFNAVKACYHSRPHIQVVLTPIISKKTKLYLRSY